MKYKYIPHGLFSYQDNDVTLPLLASTDDTMLPLATWFDYSPLVICLFLSLTHGSLRLVVFAFLPLSFYISLSNSLSASIAVQLLTI
jgi:hypothetical protein